MHTAPAAETAETIERITAAISSYQSFLITSHVAPDGDAVGSMLGLRLALQAMNKEVFAISTDGVPSSCRFLPDWQAIVPRLEKARQPDCAIILDCNGLANRVAAPYELIENASCRVLIDHHRTADPIWEINWIDPTQPATALMVFRVVQALPVEITPALAQCLYCGLATDTGNFRFSNTSPAALYGAAQLVELGADAALTAFKAFDERTFEATRLLAQALLNMQSECEGRLIWSRLGREDFEAAGAGDESSENIVNFLRYVRGASLALLLRERTDETGPVTWVSVRSPAELRCDLFCRQFGGGGHAAAAGCRVRHRPHLEAREFLLKAARAWLNEEHPPPDED